MKAAPVKVTKQVDDEAARQAAAMNRNGIIALVMAVAALVLGIIAKSI